MPIHIHIAEQRREVEDCIADHGQRPVEWLLNKVALDARWNLVHAMSRVRARSGDSAHARGPQRRLI